MRAMSTQRQWFAALARRARSGSAGFDVGNVKMPAERAVLQIRSANQNASRHLGPQKRYGSHPLEREMAARTRCAQG